METGHLPSVGSEKMESGDAASLAQQTERLSLNTESPGATHLITLEPPEGSHGDRSSEDAKLVVATDATKTSEFVRENGFNHSKPPPYQNFRPPLLGFLHTHCGEQPSTVSSLPNHLQLPPPFQPSALPWVPPRRPPPSDDPTTTPPLPWLRPSLPV